MSTTATTRLFLSLVLLAIGFMPSMNAAPLEAHPEKHAARGVVLSVSSQKREIKVSCDEIPGYMAAMAMPFSVHDSKALKGIKPGMAIQFTIAVSGDATYAENIHPAETKSFESEPMEAGTLSALNSIVNPASGQREISVGTQVPDFTLTDQSGQQVHLSQFKGKVVALTFGYSRCPNPNYCYRLSNNLERVERRFHDQGGKDLVFITVAIDPEHDKGQVLKEYADTFHANVDDWHFLTGSLTEVRQVAELFGTNFWNSEGLLTHTLHTAIIDRHGRLTTNLEGNQFTAKQLGDLIQVELHRR